MVGPDVSSIPRRLGRCHLGTIPSALLGLAMISLFNMADDHVTSISAWEGGQETERQDDGCAEREVKGNDG